VPLRVSKSVPLPCVVVEYVYIAGLSNDWDPLNDVNGPDIPEIIMSPQLCDSYLHHCHGQLEAIKYTCNRIF
jgi:hypothetical protein